MSTIHYIDLCFAVFALYCCFRLFSSKQTRYGLPPGPRRLPVIGNLLDMPTEKEWLTFAEWGRKFGDIVSVNVLGQVIIVVNSASTASEMLDKQSSIYSDRPVNTMGGELVGWKNTMVLTPYGERFRNYRRLAHQLFGNHTTMRVFHPVEELETHRLLKRLLATPAAFADHIRKTAGAIILRISHGYEVREGEDPFVTLADKATEQFALSTAPGGFLVNLIPPLRHVPGWLPGAGFKKTAKEWAACLSEMVELPYSFVKEQMAAGTAEMSYTSRLLDRKNLSANEEFEVKWSAASLYSGGADTTVSSIYSFFKAMVLFPDVQAKAKAEIDRVIGNDRLPVFDDRDQLPYINALVIELLRWHSVVPTGVPHRVTEDNIFNGYLIPKGALVLPNLWQMAHDTELYHDPMSFNPDRFIPTEGYAPEIDPREMCFGYGRRICPGRVLADASIFITCAMVLAVFDISKYSEDGVIIEPNTEQSSGTISHSSVFKCNIKPRSNKAIGLIQAEERR